MVVPQLTGTALLIEADNYPGYWQTGKYEFDITMLGVAHAWALGQFIHGVTALSHDHYILANVNYMRWMYENYVKVAELVGMPVRIVHVQCPMSDAYARNIHGVSHNVIERQFMNWEADAREEVVNNAAL